jgi:hypothetical protein
VLADLPRDLLTPEGSVANKKSPGSTSHDSIEEQIRRARELLGLSERIYRDRTIYLRAVRFEAALNCTRIDAGATASWRPERRQYTRWFRVTGQEVLDDVVE